jgi:hypothetical protein
VTVETIVADLYEETVKALIAGTDIEIRHPFVGLLNAKASLHVRLPSELGAPEAISAKVFWKMRVSALSGSRGNPTMSRFEMPLGDGALAVAYHTVETARSSCFTRGAQELSSLGYGSRLAHTVPRSVATQW